MLWCLSVNVSGMGNSQVVIWMAFYFPNCTFFWFNFRHSLIVGLVYFTYFRFLSSEYLSQKKERQLSFSIIIKKQKNVADENLKSKQEILERLSRKNNWEKKRNVMFSANFQQNQPKLESSQKERESRVYSSMKDTVSLVQEQDLSPMRTRQEPVRLCLKGSDSFNALFDFCMASDRPTARRMWTLWGGCRRNLSECYLDKRVLARRSGWTNLYCFLWSVGE